MKISRENIHRYLDGAYYVGIIENYNLNNLCDYSSKVHWIDCSDYSGGWFADPFIIKADDSTITLLVEEYRYANTRGRLSEITVDRKNYKLLSVKPILELETHLSYPYPVNHNGKLYIVPENCAANEVAIYRYDGNALVDKVKILDGNYVDTQIVHHDGVFYAFTSKTGKDTNGGSRQTVVYKSDDLYGPYTPAGTIDDKYITQRGAGLFFNLEGKTVRPCQNCEGGYGKGVIFYSVDFNQKGITQNELLRINADASKKKGLCFHTFSVYENLAAVDGFDYANRMVGRMAPALYKFKSILNRLLGR